MFRFREIKEIKTGEKITHEKEDKKSESRCEIKMSSALDIEKANDIFNDIMKTMF